MYYLGNQSLHDNNKPSSFPGSPIGLSSLTKGAVIITYLIAPFPKSNMLSYKTT